MHPIYITKHGQFTGPEDPDRLVWFSSSCTYWTDDWSTLAAKGARFICPRCRAIGLRTTYEDWVRKIEEFGDEIIAIIQTSEQQCHGENVRPADLLIQSITDGENGE